MEDLQEVHKASYVENNREDIVFLHGLGMWCHTEPSVEDFISHGVLHNY